MNARCLSFFSQTLSKTLSLIFFLKITQKLHLREFENIASLKNSIINKSEHRPTLHVVQCTA